MPESWGLPLAIVAALVFVGGFAVGTLWNVRKGDVVLKWLRQGLPLIGERTTLRWMGSSVVELKLNKAKDPFRTAETLVVFEPRDVLFLWAWARLRGRRDTLIFRSQLRTAPAFEGEVFDPHAWTLGGNQKPARLKDWTSVPLPDRPALVAYATGQTGAVGPLVELAAQTGGRLLRLSVRRAAPNLEVHWYLPDVKSGSARDLFDKLRQIGDRVIDG